MTQRMKEAVEFVLGQDGDVNHSLASIARMFGVNASELHMAVVEELLRWGRLQRDRRAARMRVAQ